MAKNNSKRTVVRERKFMAALGRGVSVGGACLEAGIGRRTAYDWRNADAEFAARWDAAVEAGTDALEDEARRRAYLGVETPVHYGGKAIGSVRKFSDALLMFMLRARRPGTYRERAATETGAGAGGPTEAMDADTTNIERVQRFIIFLEIARKAGA